MSRAELERVIEDVRRRPGAWRLLLGAAVYRRPVPRVGLEWHVGRERERAPDRERLERIDRYEVAVQGAHARGADPSIEGLGWPPEEVALLIADLARAQRGPLELPESIGGDWEPLRGAELLAPGGPGAAVWAVPYTVAGAVLRGAGRGELRRAHRRAARSWRWRVRAVAQSRAGDGADLAEARHHLREARGMLAEE